MEASNERQTRYFWHNIGIRDKGWGGKLSLDRVALLRRPPLRDELERDGKTVSSIQSDSREARLRNWLPVTSQVYT